MNKIYHMILIGLILLTEANLREAKLSFSRSRARSSTRSKMASSLMRHSIGRSSRRKSNEEENVMINPVSNMFIPYCDETEGITINCKICKGPLYNGVIHSNIMTTLCCTNGVIVNGICYRYSFQDINGFVCPRRYYTINSTGHCDFTNVWIYRIESSILFVFTGILAFIITRIIMF
jgi:hypothetical protein